MAFFHRFSLSIGLATIPEWLFSSLALFFLVLPDAGDGCARGRRERASVSPRSSRLYPARTVRWVPHKCRPLESSSHTRSTPLGTGRAGAKTARECCDFEPFFPFFALP